MGPEFYERIWIGFIQALFAQHLKSVSGYFARIRDDAADYIESIDIGLVFLPAAVTVGDRFGEESEY